MEHPLVRPAARAVARLRAGLHRTRAPRANGTDGCGHLIVEVKGQRDLRSDEKMRAALTWCERVTNGAIGETAGPWRYKLIDDYETAGIELINAVNELRVS